MVFTLVFFSKKCDDMKENWHNTMALNIINPYSGHRTKQNVTTTVMPTTMRNPYKKSNRVFEASQELCTDQCDENFVSMFILDFLM